MASKKPHSKQVLETANGKAWALQDEVRLKPAWPQTMAGFVEASKKYRGSMAGVSFERPLGTKFR